MPKITVFLVHVFYESRQNYQ